MAGAGYTPDEIDAMPVGDVVALLRHWREHPPAHEILTAVFGITPRTAPDSDDPSNIGALIARTPGGIVR